MTLAPTALVDLTQAKNYLRVDAAASIHVDAEFVGVGDPPKDEFPLVGSKIPISGSLKLYVENAPQVEDTNFSIDGYTITFKVDYIPGAGKVITASYDYAVDTDTFESYDDELLERLIAAATKKAEDYTGRAFVEREIKETHIGDSTQMLKLYKQPVVKVDSIKIDEVALTSWSERLSIGRLYHLVVWPLDAEIVVVYQAGYDTDIAVAQALIPDAVAAVLLILANLFENRTDQLKSESIAGIGSVTYDIPSQAKELLNPLRTSVL